MFDPAALSALISSTVAVLTPLLKKAVEKGAEEIGKSSAGALIDSFKQRLCRPEAKAALDDLEKQPDDGDVQAALRVQLRKAIVDDPELAAFLEQWMAQSQAQTEVNQSANVAGDNNKVAQIAGSGNTVSQ
ncbi:MULTISPECIES: hypothetical protein [Paraburkholderia]|uniref:hypothetical protein n=1 Tax=Paraburkholderia TaxID=1822464 RepID=UPI002AB7DCCC|nr:MULTISPECIES: hypothetical protein [Paraburkholderia]